MRMTVLGIAIAIATFETMTPVYAVLGGAPTWSSHSTQNTTLLAQHLSTTSVYYTVSETTLSSGTTVREYVAQNGTVFAVVWHGPRMAPVNTLLGSYFPAYLQGLSDARVAIGGGYGPLEVRQSGLVVQAAGHMGAYHGRAYLPQALPQGVSVDDIR